MVPAGSPGGMVPPVQGGVAALEKEEEEEVPETPGCGIVLHRPQPSSPVVREQLHQLKRQLLQLLRQVHPAPE